MTGASRGIGRAIAARLAAESWDLTIAARGTEDLQAAATELTALGAHVLAVPTDMMNDGGVEELVNAHAIAHPRLDALIMSAGTGTAGPIRDYPIRQLDRQIQINLRAPFLLTQLCLPQLLATAATEPETGTRIIALASITGMTAEKDLAAYGATKAGLISLCEGLNVEHSVDGVLATALAPGYVDTDMTAWIRDTHDPKIMIPTSDIADIVLTLTRLTSRTVIPNIVLTRAGDQLWRA